MRGRLGVMLGFGVGYYLGAKAGRERYEEINRYVQRFRGTSVGQAVDSAASKTKEVVSTTAERAQDSIEQVDADQVADRIVPDPTTANATTTTRVGTTTSATTGVDTTGVVVATGSDAATAAALADDLPPYTKPL